MSTAGSSATHGSGEKKAAGAFDVRNVIAALIGFYGLVLVVVGLVDNDEDALQKPIRAAMTLRTSKAPAACFSPDPLPAELPAVLIGLPLLAQRKMMLRMTTMASEMPASGTGDRYQGRR